MNSLQLPGNLKMYQFVSISPPQLLQGFFLTNNFFFCESWWELGQQYSLCLSDESSQSRITKEGLFRGRKLGSHLQAVASYHFRSARCWLAPGGRCAIPVWRYLALLPCSSPQPEESEMVMTVSWILFPLSARSLGLCLLLRGFWIQ